MPDAHLMYLVGRANVAASLAPMRGWGLFQARLVCDLAIRELVRRGKAVWG